MRPNLILLSFPPSPPKRPAWLGTVVAVAIVAILPTALAVQWFAPERYAELAFKVAIAGCIGLGLALVAQWELGGKAAATSLAGALGALYIALGPASSRAAWVVLSVLIVLGAVAVGREVDRLSARYARGLVTRTGRDANGGSVGAERR